MVGSDYSESCIQALPSLLSADRFVCAAIALIFLEVVFWDEIIQRRLKVFCGKGNPKTETHSGIAIGEYSQSNSVGHAGASIGFASL